MNKKTTKTVLSGLLVLVLLFSSSSIINIKTVLNILPQAQAAETESLDISQKKKGDIILYGSYPQSEVKDETIIKALNNAKSEWKSYGYFPGNNNIADDDWMKYCDVSLNGEKYRGVYFSKYRTPWCAADNPDISCQRDSGYYTSTYYWFKYEPLKWRVLDPDEGFVLSENVIDSQAYQERVYFDEQTYTYYNNPEQTIYANNYEASSIRKWLNDNFYNTAFTPEEKNKIGVTVLDNSAYEGAHEYDSNMTSDKIFLLSYYEISNADYGFNHVAYFPDFSRQSKSTDYAKSQGVYSVNDTQYYGDTDSWLRSPGLQSRDATKITRHGSIYPCDGVNNIAYGVRPAFKFYPETKQIRGDVNGDNRITSADARLALRIALKLDEVSVTVFFFADVNGDNNVTTADARVILRAALNLQNI